MPELFDYEKAESSAGWIRELQGEHTPETEEYGISSFTYRTAKPFDADKLHAYINDADNWTGILRSKGFFWVAADHRIAYEWAQAGGVSSVDATGMWWAAMPRSRASAWMPSRTASGLLLLYAVSRARIRACSSLLTRHWMPRSRTALSQPRRLKIK